MSKITIVGFLNFQSFRSEFRRATNKEFFLMKIEIKFYGKKMRQLKISANLAKFYEKSFSSRWLQPKS